MPALARHECPCLRGNAANASHFAGTRQIFQHIRAIRACEDHPSLKNRRGCEKISRRWCPRVPARCLRWGDGLARRTPLSALLCCVYACCVCSLAIGAAALCPVCALPILRHRLRRSMPLRLASWASLASLGRVSGVSSSRIAIRHRHILTRSLDHARLGVAVPSGVPSPMYCPYN